MQGLNKQSPWLRQAGQPAWIMGVLNCTPDSFSDGGRFLNVNAAIQHGLDMCNEGALIIDVGGESTRPGASVVSVDEEIKRTIPVIEGLVAKGCKVSIDTRKSIVMERAVQAGACMINDVSALLFDKSSLSVAAEMGVDVCLMHMQGIPETMQNSPKYHDVLSEVLAFFEKNIERCLRAGMRESVLLLDPGIGFGKRLEDNLSLVSNIDVIRRHFGLPVMLGVSRKSFLGMVTNADVHTRELETAVAGGIGIMQGTDGVRVHDVKIQRRACLLASALADTKCLPVPSMMTAMCG